MMDILPDIEDALSRETAAKDQSSEVNIRSCFNIAYLLHDNDNKLDILPDLEISIIDQTCEENNR